MVIQRDDATRSLIDFTEYTFDRYRTAAHHRVIAEQLERVERGEIDRLMLLVPPRHGKALEVSTPIPTPRGWCRIADLKPGDAVFDETGKQCRVVAVSEIWRDREVYNVITDDGDEIVADAEHEWLVRLCRKHQVQHLKTTKYLADRKSNRAPMITAQGALDLPDADLPIDPYVFGVWLGDGRTDSAAMCSADAEIIDEVSRIEGGHNEYAISGVTRHFRAGPHYREGATARETLQGRLRTLGVLGNKHIPANYLRSSVRQRTDLLQGLVDTDGYVAKDGQIEFCSTKLILAEQVRELVASLGHKASLIVGRAVLDGQDCGPKYRVMFYMAGAARLPRKASKTRHGIRAFRRYIAVEAAGRADTVCIQVDSPSRMFLCGRSMLPTHNSELASKRFPAWYLGRHPEQQFISVSATEALASDFGREVRNIIGSREYKTVFDTQLAEDSQARGKWHTQAGGIFYATGIGGSVLGRGGDCILIDDPYSSMADAMSETTRKAVWDFYQGTLYNRLQPGGKIVLINHRMHEYDLCGLLLEHQAAGGDKWEVVRLPAIEEGKALWPEAYPIETLQRIRSNTQPRHWSCLYQQNPTPDEGTYFLKDWIKTYTDAPPLKNLHVYGASDYAVTQDGGDWTVHVVVGVDPDDNMYLLDMWRGQATPDVWTDVFTDLVLKWKPLEWAEESGQITSSVGPFLSKRILEKKAFVYRRKFPTRGDKAVRAQSIRGRMAMKGLYVPVNAPWRADFERELLSFPAGIHDDIVDSIALVGQLLDHVTVGRVPVDRKLAPKELIYTAGDDGVVRGNMSILDRVMQKQRAKEQG